MMDAEKGRSRLRKGARWVLAILLIVCASYVASEIALTVFSFRTDVEMALPDDRPQLMAIIPNTSNVDITGIRSQAKQAGDQFGAFVEIYETASEAEQLQVLQIAVDSGADGVLLYPIGKEGYRAALAACKQSEIPVVLISQRIEGVDYDTFIGSQTASERMAVLSCVEATNGKGRILLMDRSTSNGQIFVETAILTPSDPLSAETGGEGLAPIETIPDDTLRTRLSDLVDIPFEGYQVECVMTMDDEQSSSYGLYNEVYQLLNQQRPDAVFSYDEDLTNVVAACLENTTFFSDIHVVGYGNIQECTDLVKSGTIDGLVRQKDAYAAFIAVRYLIQLHKGSIMPTNVDSGMTLISADNLERVLAGNGM